jgi:hypothetical protein
MHLENPVKVVFGARQLLDHCQEQIDVVGHGHTVRDTELLICVGIELVSWDRVQISGETIRHMYGKYMGQWAIER